MPEPRAGGRAARGRRAQRDGLAAEALCRAALAGDGWRVLGQRLRTAAGEIDLAAERDGVLALIEVKRRADLAGAAHALGAAQRTRLLGAAEILLAEHPDWGAAGTRFDVMVVDAAGKVRRIADAFRQEGV